jgi:hypothetical protein
MLNLFNFPPFGTVAVILLLLLMAGLGDAFGYFHSSRVWSEGQPVWEEIGKALAGFGVAIGCHWYAVRHLNTVVALSPEVQTLALFAVTMLGLALVSRQFFHWHPVDQAVAALMVCAMGWLLVRTGG